MSTMDVLGVVGGKPANFLDGGGGATEANVKAALELLMSDPDVDVVFINTFGGLTRTVSLPLPLSDPSHGSEPSAFIRTGWMKLGTYADVS